MKKVTSVRRVCNTKKLSEKLLVHIHTFAVAALVFFMYAVSTSDRFSRITRPIVHTPTGNRSSITSDFTVRLSPRTTAYREKPYSIYYNVQYTQDKLTYFYGDGFKVPPATHIVNALIGNGTRFKPAGTLVFEGSKPEEPAFMRYPVEYLPASQYQPNCTSWIDRPTYLSQIRYSHNVWHTWGEGLLPTFQTMRELGHIILIEVDNDGNVRQVTEGGECAQQLTPGWIWYGQEPTDCKNTTRYRSAVQDIPSTCDIGSVWWCWPGVWSLERDDGPLLLPFTPSSFKSKWSPLFDAMTSHVAEHGSLEGACFKELVIGRTSALEFKGFGGEITWPKEAYYTHRKTALAVFKRFVVSAAMELGRKAVREYIRIDRDLETVKKLDTLPGVFYQGYCQPEMELLRKGIGPEDIELAQVIKSTFELPGLDDDDQLEFGQKIDATQYKVSEAVSKWQAYRDKLGIKRTIKLPNGATEFTATPMEDEFDCPAVDNTTFIRSNTWNQEIQFANYYEQIPLEKPRPQVTLFRRETVFPEFDRYSRSIVNLHDVATYILARYNVTLKVTTFAEPLLETIRLMSHSDVVLGMHGAGWTNLLFVKPGASVLQMYPYGWRRPRTNSNFTRGINYRLITEASQCKYMEWGNSNPQDSFIRPRDFRGPVWNNLTYSLHPQPEWPASWEVIGSNRAWIYSATYVDMDDFYSYADELMSRAGIEPMPT